MTKKECSRCKVEKDLSEFYTSTQRHKYGVHSNCKKCVIQYQKEYRRNNPIKTWCSRTIRDHRYSGYEVLFKAKELFSIAEKTTHCSICNNPLGWKFGKGKAQDNSPTLDRVNNQKKLTLNTIWIICRKCNTTKQNRTLLEFYNYCKKFVKLWKGVLENE